MCVPLHNSIWECMFHSSITGTSTLNLKITENNSAGFRLIRNFTDSLCTSESSLTSVIFIKLNLQIYSENYIKIWMLYSAVVSLYAQKIAWFLKYSEFSDAYYRFSKQ